MYSFIISIVFFLVFFPVFVELFLSLLTPPVYYIAVKRCIMSVLLLLLCWIIKIKHSWPSWTRTMLIIRNMVGVIYNNNSIDKNTLSSFFLHFYSIVVKQGYSLSSMVYPSI